MLPTIVNDAHQPSQLIKRSADDIDSNSGAWRVAAPGDDVSVAEKRFNEFVGKRADAVEADKRYEFVGKRTPYEFVGKRPYEFLGKRSPYEFLGKRNPYEFLGKRSPYEFLGKRSPYEFLGKRSPYEFLGKRTPYEFVGKRPYEFLGKRSPYEFLGKRSPYEFLGKRSSSKRALVDFYGKRVELPYEFVGKRIYGSAWERLSTNTFENDEMVKDVTDVMSTRDAGDKSSPSNDSNGSSSAPSGSSASGDKSKRYSEWLGKRSQISDELLRQLVNKRISAIVRQRLQNNNTPEFIGRREEDEGQEESLPSSQGGDFGMKKRYTEFVGK